MVPENNKRVIFGNKLGQSIAQKGVESEKDGEPRKQVPEEGFECEEGWEKYKTFLCNSSQFSIFVCILQDIL